MKTGGKCVVYDIDQATGALTLNIEIAREGGTLGFYTGVEFSNDSKYLYISQDATSNIYVYDTEDADEKIWKFAVSETDGTLAYDSVVAWNISYARDLATISENKILASSISAPMVTVQDYHAATGAILRPTPVTVIEHDTYGDVWNGTGVEFRIKNAAGVTIHSSAGPPNDSKKPSEKITTITLDAGSTYTCEWADATGYPYYTENEVIINDANGNELIKLTSSSNSVAPTGPDGVMTFEIPIELNPVVTEPEYNYVTPEAHHLVIADYASMTGNLVATAIDGGLVKIIVPFSAGIPTATAGDLLLSDAPVEINPTVGLRDNGDDQMELSFQTKALATGSFTLTDGTNTATIFVNSTGPGTSPTSSINSVTFYEYVQGDTWGGKTAKFNVNINATAEDAGKRISILKLSKFQSNVYGYSKSVHLAHDLGFEIKVTQDGVDYWVLGREGAYSGRTVATVPSTPGVVDVEIELQRSGRYAINGPGMYAVAVDGPDFAGLTTDPSGIVMHQGSLTLDNNIGTLGGAVKVFEHSMGNNTDIYKVVQVTKGTRDDGSPCYLYDGEKDINIEYSEAARAAAGGDEEYLVFDLSHESLRGTRMRFSPFPAGLMPKPDDSTPIVITVKNSSAEAPFYEFIGPNGKAIDIDNYIMTRERTYRFMVVDDSIADHPFQLHNVSNVAVSQATVTSASGDAISAPGEYMDFKVGGTEDAGGIIYRCKNHPDTMKAVGTFVYTQKVEYGLKRMPADVAQDGWLGKDADYNNTGVFDGTGSWQEIPIDGSFRTVSMQLSERMLPITYMYDALSAPGVDMGGSITMTERSDGAITKFELVDGVVNIDYENASDFFTASQAKYLPFSLMSVTKSRTRYINLDPTKYSDEESYWAVENPNDGQMYYIEKTVLNLSSALNLNSTLDEDLLKGDNKKRTVSVKAETLGLQPGSYCLMADPAWWTLGYAGFGYWGEMIEALPGEPGYAGNNILFLNVTAEDLPYELVPSTVSGIKVVDGSTQLIDNRYLKTSYQMFGDFATETSRIYYSFLQLSNQPPEEGEVTRYFKWGTWSSEDKMYYTDITEDGVVTRYYIKEAYMYYYPNVSTGTDIDSTAVAPFAPFMWTTSTVRAHMAVRDMHFDMKHPIHTSDERFADYALKPNTTYAIVFNTYAYNGLSGSSFPYQYAEAETDPFEKDNNLGSLDLKDNYGLFRTEGASIPENAVSIYIGTDTFAADAQETGSKPLTDLPDFEKLEYSVNVNLAGSKLVDLLSKVRMAVSVDEFDDFADDQSPDRVDQVRTYQVQAGKSFDMNELENLGIEAASLAGLFAKSEGADDVVVGDKSIPMDIKNKDALVASAVPKALGAQVPLTAGKDEVLRIMVNEADFADLVAFSLKGVGATDSNGNTGVTLQSLLGSVSSNVGESIVFSEVNTDNTKSVKERKIGHEIMSALFRAFPAGHDNTNKVVGTVWEHADDDHLALRNLPEVINLQFVLQTELSLKNEAGEVVLSTKPSPTEATDFDSVTELPADSKRVLILYNFIFGA